jgi:hypothetical protein
MAIMQIFEIMSEKYNIVAVCAKLKLASNYINIKLQLYLLSSDRLSNRMNPLNETWRNKFFLELFVPFLLRNLSCVPLVCLQTLFL